MRSLHPHPQSIWPGAAGTAAAEREGTELLLRFDLRVADREVVVPQALSPARRDGLWRTTCFEAFARPAGSEAYFEINLAPSGDWAFYHFTARRAGMSSPDVTAPAVDFRHEGDGMRLRASIDLAGHLSPAVPWEVSLTAVIEGTDGELSYWALAHPPEGPPDFHHPDCFALALAPPSAA